MMAVINILYIIDEYLTVFINQRVFYKKIVNLQIISLR